MINRILSATAAAALLSLAACGQSEPDVVDSRGPDPMASQLANAAPVELPPAMTASVTFRCADNSLVSADFFQGDKMINFRPEKDKPAIKLTADEAGKPYAGEGYSVAGDAKSVKVTKPGKDAISCKA